MTIVYNIQDGAAGSVMGGVNGWRNTGSRGGRG